MDIPPVILLVIVVPWRSGSPFVNQLITTNHRVLARGAESEVERVTRRDRNGLKGTLDGIDWTQPCGQRVEGGINVF